MQVIYLDELFAGQLAADYLLLLSAAWVCGEPVRRWRLALGAVLGAAYGCLAALPGAGFAASPWLRGAAGVAMALAAFGGSRRLLRVTLAFFCAGALYSGAALALGSGLGAAPGSLRVLAAAFGLTYAVLWLGFRRCAGGAGGGGTVPVEIVLADRRIQCRALADTGCDLSEPLTGRRVMVLELTAALPLFSPAEQAVLRRFARDPAGLMAALGTGPLARRFRLVPYHALGTPRGMLAAFRPDRVSCLGRDRQLLVALSPDPVSDGGAWQAVVPGAGIG